MIKEIKSLDKKAWAWSFFDFGSSAHSLIIFSFIFPIFFKEVIAKGPRSDFYWGLITSLAILLAAIVSPLVGAISDIDGKRKSKYVLFTILCCIFTGLLFYSDSSFLIGSAIFIASSFCLSMAQMFNDSLLLKVSNKKNVGIISGLGYGLGYLGGIVAMFLFMPLYTEGYEINLISYKLTFVATALFVIIFCIPSFIFIKEDNNKKNSKSSFLNNLKTSLINIKKTFASIKKRKNIFTFLIAWFVLNDALLTLFAFVSIYAATTLAISVKQIFIGLLLAQLIAFPASVITGKLSDKFGPKKILSYSIVGWIVATIILTFGSSLITFYSACFLVGLVLGGSQSVARSWYARIIPKNKASEFFGFNSLGSKFSAVVGPVLFGAVSSFTGSQRIASGVMIPIFILAFFLFLKVKEK